MRDIKYMMVLHRIYPSNLPIQDPPFLQTLPKIRLQELPHANILTKPLPPPRLQHKIPRRRHRTRHLQWARLDLPVQRIPRHDNPPIKDETDHRLALRMDPHIGFEAEAVDDGDEAPDAVERGPRYGAVGQDVASSFGEDGVERGEGVGGAGHGDGVEGFEEAGGGGQEG